jgi:hypothetical protein
MRVISSGWFRGDRLRGCESFIAGLIAAGFDRVGGGIHGPIRGLTQGPGPRPGTFISGATRSASTWAAAMAGIEVSWWWWWLKDKG